MKFENEITLRGMIDMFLHYVEDRGGYLDDSLSLSKMAIGINLLNFRAKILKRLDLQGLLTAADYQPLPCVELIPADPMKCPCQPPSGCIWLESKEILPEFIKLHSVTSTTAKRRFLAKEWHLLEDSLGGRSKMGKKDYYTTRRIDKGLRLVILTDDFLKSVTVDGLFNRPYEACAFPVCGEVDLGAQCNPLDQIFSLPAEYLDEVCLMTFNKIATLRQKATVDLLNNDRKDA